MSKRRPSRNDEGASPALRRNAIQPAPAAWLRRVFRNSFTRGGRSFTVKRWAFKVQFQGRRRTFSLSSRTRTEAAREAQQLYELLVTQGWEAALHSHGAARRPDQVTSLAMATSLAWKGDVAYWEQRLIQRRYREARLGSGDELSVRIEHEDMAAYFPLGSAMPRLAAAQAEQIYQTVITHGWLAAWERFDREITLAVSWAENPLAVTYATLFTFASRPAPPPPNVAVGDRLRKRIVVIEPDATVHGCLRYWLDQQAGFACAALFRTAEETWNRLEQERAAVVLANRATPGLAEFTRTLKAQRPELPLFTHQIHEDSDRIWTSIYGVSGGYILRRRRPDALFDPLQPAARTRSLPASEARRLVENYFQSFFGQSTPHLETTGAVLLTSREQEILSHVSKGLLDKEIAHLLNISIWTVHNHVKNIYEKLGVHNRTEAALKLLQK